MDLIVRDILPDDMDAMREVYAASVRANPAGFIQDLSYHGDIRELARELPSKGGCFAVGLLDGRVVALGALRPSQDHQGMAELCKLHLRAELQGKGYGRAVAEYLMARARELGFNGVDLHVTVTQAAAIGLYRKLGFAEDRTEVWEKEIGGKMCRYDSVFMHRAL